MKKLVKKIIYKGTLEVKTGLHIGAEKNTVEIGGIDNPVVRCVLKDRQPYIPGSSLKGKLRSLLQIAQGENNEEQSGSVICQLFGASDKREIVKVNDFENLPELHKKYILENNLNKEIKKDEKLIGYKLLGHRSRLIVRDAYLTEESKEKLKKANEAGFTDMPYTEMKMENRIDRIRGTAEHPRQQERIPAGTTFDVEFIINVYDGDNDNLLKNTFEQAIELLRQDYLGGSGSRGYGQVEIKLNPPVEYKIENGKKDASSN
jgi:CRISPR-associated protein Csm3